MNPSRRVARPLGAMQDLAKALERDRFAPKSKQAGSYIARVYYISRNRHSPIGSIRPLLASQKPL